MRAEGAVTGFESEVYRKDRSRFWMSEDAIAIRDRTDRLIGFYGTVIDVTARKRAEEASALARIDPGLLGKSGPPDSSAVRAYQGQARFARHLR